MTSYKPKCLVKPQPPPREVFYAVGLEHRPDEFGMVFGPCKETECLEYVGTATACIIRFNADWTDDVVWRWDAADECWRSTNATSHPHGITANLSQPMNTPKSDQSQTTAGLDSMPMLGSFKFIETATLPEPELGRVYAYGRIEITGTVEEIRKNYESTKDPRTRMLLEIARQKAALAPFAAYVEKHGASNLCGANGAYLRAEDWMEAHAAFHGLPNA